MHSSADDAPRSAGWAAATFAASCDSLAPTATEYDAAKSIASDSSHGRHDEDPALRMFGKVNDLQTYGNVNAPQ